MEKAAATGDAQRNQSVGEKRREIYAPVPRMLAMAGVEEPLHRLRRFPP
jgi:hypothetical protein